MKKITKVVCVALSLVGILAAGAACGQTEAEEPPKEEKVLMIGDSLFDLWKPDCYTALEGAKNLTNIAVGGTNSIYWTKGVKLVKIEDPTEIVISIGTNNIADLRQTGKEAAEGEFGIQQMLQTLHENCPDAYIYLLTVNICGETIRWEMREEIRTCNALMREYCAKYDWVEIVETEYAFYDDDDYTQKPNPDYFVADYLHFSARGYIVLKGILREALGLDSQ